MRMLRRPAHPFRARRFGQEQAFAAAASIDEPQGGIAQDLRTFALTFAGGFLFMAVYLA